MRVLVIGAIAPEGVAHLRERGIDVDAAPDTLANGELYGRLAGCEAVITRSSTAVPAEFLARACSLRILGRAGVGVDNIDGDADRSIYGSELYRKTAVNLVNGRLVARERGLEIAVHTDEDAGSGYTNLVTVTTQAGTARKILAGTVFDGVPRIVRLKDLHIECIPEGHILVLSYEDRPGVVGRIGSILGRHNVNIASMHVRRRTRRGCAIVVLLLDEDVADEVVEEAEKAVQADFARIVRLGP